MASAVVAGVVGSAYVLLTWDAWLTNFQVRWMCDEERAFALVRREDVSVLALQAGIARADPRALTVFGEAYPEVLVAGAEGARRARYELVERWPKLLRDYWGFGVMRTDFSVVDREDRNRVLATMGLFRRVERGSDGLRAARNTLGPPAQQCVASDRLEFVKGVLRPPE